MLAEVVILVPIYSESLSSLELATIEHNVDILSGHSIFLICPESLDFTFFPTCLQQQKRITFPSNHFESLEAYNKLLRSTEFYSTFTDYQYILILQTDAYIFEDTLPKFTSQDYDYWGAPWIDYELINYIFLRPVLPLFHKSRHLKWARSFVGPKYLVGNGGLSLRKVKTHLEITEKYRDKIIEFESHHDEWIKLKAKSMMEDLFWCFYAPQFYPDYKIAPWQEALKFSFEMNPSRAFDLNNKKLPFGCHAFAKTDPEFYSQFIPFLRSGNQEVSPRANTAVV